MSSEVINLDSINRHNDLETSEYDLAESRSGKVKRVLRFVCTKICAGIIILGIISIVIVCVAFLVSYENEGEVTLTVGVLKKNLSPEQDFWFKKALDDLESALNTPINTKKAQNVILFLADGFEPDAINSARVRRYGTNGSFTWERFPHVGVVRWNNQLAVGTAIFGGVGALRGTSGVDSSVRPDDCLRMDDDRTHVESILSWAQQSDLKTGLITNGDIRSGTSVALYAHMVNDSWACPSMLPEQTQHPRCLDSGTQLRFNAPGRKLNVLMGWNTVEAMCGSEHALKDSWKQDGHSIAEEASDFVSKINDHDDTEYIRALLPATLRAEISLQAMVTKALQLLTEDSDGFILIVVCEPVSKFKGDVDINELDEAVKIALSALGNSLEDTLLITTFTPLFNPHDSTKDETKDSIIYATGPMSHLFRNLQDPTFIAHVISYAARLGRFRDSLLTNSLLQWF